MPLSFITHGKLPQYISPFLSNNPYTEYINQIGRQREVSLMVELKRLRLFAYLMFYFGVIILFEYILMEEWLTELIFVLVMVSTGHHIKSNGKT